MPSFEYMKEIWIALLFVVYMNHGFGQHFNADSLNPPADFENIHVERLVSTSDATSFVIWVRNDVRAHKHLHHTEHVYVIEGNGIMLLGDDTLDVAPKDIIAIPPGTVHAVINQGNTPLKVVSIQAPEFKGGDRHFVPVPGWSPN
jgi:mannose-6-phosphate isomerase-like protein (cupin superfamily)